MSGFRIKYKVLAISVCLVFAGWAAVSAEEFLPVSEVREGMHGYAKTVVHGTQVETFDVDVLGVMKQKGATGGDLILVKVSGDLIDKTEGIAQGMSGSPIVQNGVLIGAVTHVFVQDPTRGYAVHSRFMYDYANSLSTQSGFVIDDVNDVAA